MTTSTEPEDGVPIGEAATDAAAIEPDAIDARKITLSLIVSALIVIAAVVLVHTLYPERPGVTEITPGEVSAPEPRLQLDPPGDLQRLREREAAHLRGGAGRPSIEQAMSALVAREQAR